MKTIIMHVGLKIPDTTAITAFNTIKKMGYRELESLSREIFYEFDVLRDDKKFLQSIKDVDVLVNANKNYASTWYVEDVPKSKEIGLLITNSDIRILAGQKAEQYIHDHLGATDQIFKVLKESYDFISQHNPN